MFGMTASEMTVYREMSQYHAINTIAPIIIEESEFVAPLIEGNKSKRPKPDMEHVKQVVTDINSIITMTTIHTAYEYAHMQTEIEKDESDIIAQLHTKYETYLINQFIDYGITFGVEAIARIIGEIIIELPYIYSSAIEDVKFNPDTFLEENMEAYEKYLGDNFPNFLEERDDEEDDE